MLCIYECVCFSTTQIKRCGEMARKLRLFKDQMTKAGLSPSTRITRSNDIDLDNLEVAIYCNIDFFFQMSLKLLMSYIEINLCVCASLCVGVRSNLENLKLSC